MGKFFAASVMLPASWILASAVLKAPKPHNIEHAYSKFKLLLFLETAPVHAMSQV